MKQTLSVKTMNAMRRQNTVIGSELKKSGGFSWSRVYDLLEDMQTLLTSAGSWEDLKEA